MFTAHDSVSFFPDDIPRGIPSDAETPDFEALKTKALSLASSDHNMDAVNTILAREHSRLGAGALAMSAISSIGNDTVFVIAGQQAGLFGGPLYSLYKAMHAVSLAKRLADSTGLNVLPVFWIASDDHDFEEVASHTVLSRQGDVSTISYRPDTLIDFQPVGDIILDSGIETVINDFQEALPPGDIGDKYLALIRSAWQVGVSWSEAFSRQFLGLFQKHGLILFDPRWDGAKALLTGIYQQELADPLKSSALVNEQADILEKSTGKRGLRKPQDSTNLFLETAGVRQALHFADGSFLAGDSTLEKTDLDAILEKEPKRLSPGAALRPVCQDSLFPTVALIGGPGERLYLSQLAPLYEHFAVAASTVWPRASFSVIDKKSTRNAEKESIALCDLFTNYEKLMASLAKGSFPADAANAFEALESSIVEGYDRIATQIGNIDQSLSGAADKEKGRALHSVGKLKERAVRAHKASLDLSEKRLRAITSFLMPDGAPQERRLGVDAILQALAGEGFAALIELCSPGEESHRIVEM